MTAPWPAITGALYRHRGRWVLVAASLGGWLGSLIVQPDARFTAGALALLAGSVVLNVIKEEVPAERESRFWAFALRTAAYGALLAL